VEWFKWYSTYITSVRPSSTKKEKKSNIKRKILKENQNFGFRSELDVQ
jgi:hypothetical protein